jgi:putative nucleotidyltransferase with HDIG domain
LDHTPQRTRSPHREVYIWSVVAVGWTLIACAAWRLTLSGVDLRWYILVGITALSAWARLRMPMVPISFSISDSFTITSALLFGPWAGVIVVALEGLVLSSRLRRNESFGERVLFNTAAPTLAMGCAAGTFFYLAGVSPLLESATPVSTVVVPLAAFAGVFFLVNTGLVAGAISFEQGRGVVSLWREHFVGLWLTYFGGAAVAALMIALVNSQQQEFLMLAIVAPIPFILYATFKSVVGRMEDRVGHLDEVARMHVATIEMLAHAIDAKDQVTHGHIRRVQQYTVALAKALGVSDEADLRAIQAASLLHDIGKLAVPEHILNKPGPLTPAEYEQMKQHAHIGADILAMVKFPFPVVPIVRHHHESWDGRGYPDGLKGEAIPLGARILSVVDCFDALTSDRPYRKAMALEEAIRLLRNRSGTMYEPRVVERFIEIQPAVARELDGSVEQAFEKIARTARPQAEAPSPAAGERDAMAAIFELGRALGSASDARTALVAAHAALRRVMPVETSVLYVHDADSDTLMMACAAGVHEAELGDVSIPRGQRLTGWVAANGRTMMNSDAALDLGNLVVTLQPTPLSCLSTPVASKDELVGVLTLYSSAVEPFTPAHGAIAEVIAGGLAPLAARVPVRRDLPGPSPVLRPSTLRLVGHRAEAAGGRGQ